MKFFKNLVVIAGAIAIMGGMTVKADNNDVRVISLKHKVDGSSTFQSVTVYYNGGDIYSIRDYNMYQTNGVRNITFYPVIGKYFAVKAAKKKNGTENELIICNNFTTKNGGLTSRKVDLKFKNLAKGQKFEPNGMVYTAEGKHLLVSGSDNCIHFLETTKYTEVRNLQIGYNADKIAVSSNNYFIVTLKDVMAGAKAVDVWNMETGQLRKQIVTDANVNDVSFSNDNSMLAVAMDNGVVNLYDTKTFAVLKSIAITGKAKSVFFHKNDKYIAVRNSDTSIAVVNIKDESDKHIVKVPASLTSTPTMSVGVEGTTYMTYLDDKRIYINKLYYILPNRSKLVSEALNARLSEWSKQMEGESDLDYRARVTDDSRLEQMRLIENELVTSMAGDMLDGTTVGFGNYNMESNMLEVTFSTMAPIYLNIPEDELGAFSTSESLQFMNTIYALDDKDNFELIYADVLNKNNGKTYTFDNRNKQSLNYFNNNDNYIPLEVLRLNSSEQQLLTTIKEQVVEEAKRESQISGHTNITVNTNVESDYNADGQQIYNYRINYEYDVDMEYSAKDDFGPGRYKLEESQAALTMLAIVKKAFAGNFGRYIVPGKKLEIRVYGTADASSIVNKYFYNGEYGEFVDAVVYNHDDMSSVDMKKGDQIKQNEHLAFLRAQGVKDYVVKNMDEFKQMANEYKTFIQVSKESGSQFRRIGIEFKFVDVAF